VSDTNPRRRRSGSIRGAKSEPLGLDAAGDAAGDAPGAPESAGPEPAVHEPAPDAQIDDDAALAAGTSSALVPLIDPHGEATDVIRDVPEMSVEDVERRIGARTRQRNRRAAMAVPATTRAAANRRVILWRDSATILIFVVIALLAARFLLPSNAGTATASGSSEGSPVDIGSIPASTGLDFSAAPTLGNVVPSGLHIDATPTPIPVITLPPPTPTPVPTPTLKPGTTPKPTHTPTPTPSHTPAPSPTAPPHAAFTPTCTGTDAADFDASASTAGTGATITSYDWSWDDGSPNDSTANPLIHHDFLTSGSHNVVLVIHTSTGGQDSTPLTPVSCP
jgi:PKD domain-containing protein